jgi:hypothetical protein
VSDPDNGPDAESGSESGEQAPLDVDSAFAAIVAQWGTETTTGGWPASEDLPTTQGDDEEPAAGSPRADEPRDSPDPAPAPLPPARGEPLIPHIGPPPERAEAADEERFVPPEPPPLPRGDAFTMLAWGGVLLGPIFLLVCVLVWQTAPQTYILAAVVAFVGGFATLVMRMPKHRDDDDDDGAVV